jgi:GTP cyclohydrolase IA
MSDFDLANVEFATKRLLQSLGDDHLREGLQETPKRVADAWKFWTSGYDQDPKTLLKEFKDGSDDYDQMITLGNILTFSICEHHLVPFFGTTTIAYIPNKKIVGISKLARLVEVFARRLQVQERLTTQIANSLVECINPLGVGVVIKCRHLCMESRGIQKSGTVLITSALRGVIETAADAREEFLRFVQLTGERSL